VDREQFQKTYGKIVAKAWADEGFKQRLLSDPTTVLKEHGIDIPEGVEFKVVEQSRNLIHLILPPKPDPAAFSAEDLRARAAAGFAFYCI